MSDVNSGPVVINGQEFVPVGLLDIANIGNAAHIRQIAELKAANDRLLAWQASVMAEVGAGVPCEMPTEPADIYYQYQCALRRSNYFQQSTLNLAAKLTEIATAIHYPQCWDTAAYPTLFSAINEMAHCTTCEDATIIDERENPCHSDYISDLELPQPLSGEPGPVIDLKHAMYDQLVKAASESNWIPPEYMANDWIADCCNFLRLGAFYRMRPAQLDDEHELQAACINNTPDAGER